MFIKLGWRHIAISNNSVFIRSERRRGERNEREDGELVKQADIYTNTSKSSYSKENHLTSIKKFFVFSSAFRSINGNVDSDEKSKFFRLPASAQEGARDQNASKIRFQKRGFAEK